MLRFWEEAQRCLLCVDAPCTAACRFGQDPASMVRSTRFENGTAMPGCVGCGACETACIHFDHPIRIRQMQALLPKRQKARIDLSIPFCGVRCENPFFLSSSVVASGYEMCAKALRLGWAGVVYKTIGFLTPNEASPRFGAVGEPGESFFAFRNMEQISDHALEDDLEVLRRLKRDFPQKVIVASIMGATAQEWETLARMCEQAGCDMIECNFSCPHMTGHGLGADVGTDPSLVAAYTEAVRRGTSLPVIAKMTPNITNMELPAKAAVAAGADALAAINTIKSLTGFSLPSLAAEPAVDEKTTVSGLSGNAVKPIALRFLHDLAACDALQTVPLSGMGGIETWRDAADFLALGCTNLQVTTSVMQYGYRIIEDLLDGLSCFLAENGYENLSQFVGCGLPHIADAAELDRSTVSYPSFDTAACLGCGRCYLSCCDAGHQAIRFGADRKPKLDQTRCVGCHLCRLVCPAVAITPSPRKPKHS